MSASKVMEKPTTPSPEGDDDTYHSKEHYPTSIKAKAQGTIEFGSSKGFEYPHGDIFRFFDVSERAGHRVKYSRISRVCAATVARLLTQPYCKHLGVRRFFCQPREWVLGTLGWSCLLIENVAAVVSSRMHVWKYGEKGGGGGEALWVGGTGAENVQGGTRGGCRVQGGREGGGRHWVAWVASG